MISDEFPNELWALPVTVRCQNIFKRNGIQTLADLTKMTKFDLLMLPNLGRKSVQEIVEVLAERGLALSTGPEDHYRWIQMGKQVNRQLKGLANMRDELNYRESETEDQSTWMARTGGYARDMTLHDHFAGLAMQTLFMDADFCAQFDSSQALRIAIANGAYLVADAMLDEREKK
jgi:hypothetical protein